MDLAYAEALELAMAEGCISAATSSTHSSEDAAAAHVKVVIYNTLEGAMWSSAGPNQQQER